MFSIIFVIYFWRIGESLSHKCPELIADSRTSLRGNFSSPAWPSPYPPDAVCHYRLQGVNWEGVKVTFHHFNLEPPYSAGCLSDYLELATVDIEGTRTFRGRFCGGELPPPILLLHPTLELLFRSNHAVHHSGFFASYEFIDEAFVTPPSLNGTSPCGGVVTGIGGIISSPGYPKGYSAGLDCLWLIRVPYSHAIYIRIQQLEFQGSIANCGKAELGIYDGYEHSLESTEALKRYCGDLRYYKGEEERVVLSSRNRLLIRFQTREPSKPVLATTTSNSLELNVGFRLIWSDVEFNTPENCSKQSRFACTEARFCFTKNHMGGASNCPDLRHYCISSDLVCDNLAHCSEQDPSDEKNCYRGGIILLTIVIPLAILFIALILCYIYYKRHKTPAKNYAQAQENLKKAQEGCWKSNASVPRNNFDLAPISRHPITLQNDLESPGLMSPASGFSDTESESSLSAHGASFYCPAHGPLSLSGPLRHFPLPYPLLPILQEGDCYEGSENYNEPPSTLSSAENLHLAEIEQREERGQSRSFEDCGEYREFEGRGGRRAVEEWRRREGGVRNGREFWDDKSSETSSPYRAVCPRCEVQRGIVRQGSSTQFDSGIEQDSTETVKNVSFDTATSSDISMSRFPLHSMNNASIQTDMSGMSTSTSNGTADSLITTVTTFGVQNDFKNTQNSTSKATDV